MFSNSKYSYSLSESENLQSMLDKIHAIVDKLSSNELESLNLKAYKYDSNITKEELGLECDLVDELVVDCVIQVLESCEKLLNYVYELKLNYTDETLNELRELAHKNLGVVKNLRMKNAEIFLSNIMTLDDLDGIQSNIEGLIVCSIMVEPEQSFNTLKLLDTKKVP